MDASMSHIVSQEYLGLFACIKNLLFSVEFKERQRQRPANFTRRRCLPFALVIIFLLNLVKRALQDELDEFFKLLMGAEIATRLVSKSAFSQARLKVKYEAFVELNQAQVNYYYDHSNILKWNGFRLVAVDGSMSELPNQADIEEHFGIWHPAAGGTCPKARISQMFDVLNKITLDAVIAPKEQGERVLAGTHFSHLKAGDLVLLDRGYPAFWLFARILQQKANFCARMKLTSWIVVRQFIASTLQEQIVHLKPTPSAVQDCKDHNISAELLTVRLIRVELDTGEIEVLITSILDAGSYPVSVFKELYHCRWPVEEDYKALKTRIEVENWSGLSVLAVYQDFHAKVFAKNLTCLLARPAQVIVEQETRHNQLNYQINMTNAFSKMKDTLVLLLSRSSILPLLEKLWQLMIKTIEPVRPGRSFPRIKRVKPQKFAASYKPIR
jgi:hypothetical protein